MADVVLPYPRGAGVTKLIAMLLAGELDALPSRSRSEPHKDSPA
jgi:hypothetical protein